MEYKRLLTIQDISCVGQCSLTVALPIISACGIECSVLPSAVLSTHTGCFSGYTFRDLTDDMPSISRHWQNEGLYFDAIYTGYLGSARQIEYVKEIFRTNGKDGCLRVVDPAMADNGRLYAGFDGDFPKKMLSLCADADCIIPNITEACLMTDTPYRTEYDRTYVDTILNKLSDKGCKTIIITGISYDSLQTGVAVYENEVYSYYGHEKIDVRCHGTGDIYASAFVGATVCGKSASDSAKIAADYTLECIKYTQNIPNHEYGAAFEPLLGRLIEAVKR